MGSSFIPGVPTDFLIFGASRRSAIEIRVSEGPETRSVRIGDGGAGEPKLSTTRSRSPSGRPEAVELIVLLVGWRPIEPGSIGVLRAQGVADLVGRQRSQVDKIWRRIVEAIVTVTGAR